MTDKAQDLSSQPGRILRTARDEMGLSIDQVADDLHLRASVVEAMEQEDYEAFDSDVFLKGYYRSYCRLVNLHEARMIELLENQLGDREKARHESRMREKQLQQQRARKKIVKSVVLLGSLALIVIVSLTLLLPSGSNEGSDDLSGTPPGNESAESKVSESLDAVPDSDAVKMDNPEPPLVETGGVAQAGMQSDLPTETPEDEMFETQSDKDAQTVIDVQARAVSATNEERVDAVNDAGQAPSPPVRDSIESTGLASIEVSFVGDCWFQLTESSGRTIIADLKRKGDVVSYEGTAPFRVVLGDARQAAMRFNGEPVDLAPHTARNGRAQLQLSTDS